MTAPPAQRPGFPLGGVVTLAGLEARPYRLLARLRRDEPVSWLPVLGGWLVTRRDLAVRVLRDSAAFTVDDPRFTTARVVGPSMLSLDGAEHGRHRAPFGQGFSHAGIRTRLGGFVQAQAQRLVSDVRPAGEADLRRDLAGPLAAAVMAEALGLDGTDPATMLGWYGAIVAAVSALAGDPQAVTPAVGAQAFQRLDASLRAVIGTAGGGSLLAGAVSAGLSAREAVSNAAVLMFGGIETTEGMIGNAVYHLLTHPRQLALVRADPGLVGGAIEESLRLEPAAAMADRYATRDIELGGARIERGDLVSVSLTGAGRDPAVFRNPGRHDIRRPNARLHLAFAHRPHFCLGAQLARLEARAAILAVLHLPGLRLGPDHSSAPRGVVFRKPPSLPVRWDPG